LDRGWDILSNRAALAFAVILLSGFAAGPGTAQQNPPVQAPPFANTMATPGEWTIPT
jgi:hypothetical protein